MGKELTYSALLEHVHSMAAALQSMGVKKGDRVAVHLPNCTQFPIAFFGALSLGAIAVPCNPMYVARELAYQLKDSGAETIVTLTRFYNTIKEIESQTNLKNIIVTNIKDFFPGFLRFLYTAAREKKEGDRVALQPGDHDLLNLLDTYRGKAFTPAEVKPTDRAVLMYTGGSTGVSKGAILSHRNLVANELQVKAWDTESKSGQEVILAYCRSSIASA